MIMNSLKNFKRLIIEGKESPLQAVHDENVLPQGLRIPEIRDSAYKVIHKRSRPQETRKEHSLTKKSPLKIPSESKDSSPIKRETEPQATIVKESSSTFSSHYNTKDLRLKRLELTEEELECLSSIVRIQKEQKQPAFEGESPLMKIHQKIQQIKRTPHNTECSRLKSHNSRSHTNSDHATQVLSFPSFDSTKTDTEEFTYEKVKKDKKDKPFFDSEVAVRKNDIQFKKIMYILESKNKAVGSLIGHEEEEGDGGVGMREQGQQKLERESRQQEAVVHPVWRREERGPPKKAELLEIVSMLNTKYNKNIQFN